MFQIAVPVLEAAGEGGRTLTVTQGSDKFEDRNFMKSGLPAATSVNTVCQLVKPLPAGALPGVFRVSETKKVRFSKGNLWYETKEEEQESALHFESEQWMYEKNGRSSHVSYFKWCDKVADAVQLGGATYSGDFFFCDESHKQSIDGSGAIYYALSKDEWCYLFAYDSAKEEFVEQSSRYGLFKYGVTVCGEANCVVLLPDDWKWGGSVGEGWQDGGYPATTDGNQVIWKTMEDAGAVCLPAAGWFLTWHGGGGGGYWSSSSDDPDTSFAYGLSFNSSNVYPSGGANRYDGRSVRLITECQ